MGKKFMIVKPKPCCGDTSGIGRIFESSVGPIRTEISRCTVCKGILPESPLVPYCISGWEVVIQESRVVWLPDEDEFKNETYDEELTV